MIEVKGKYNTAKVFTDNLDESGRVQIERLCDQPYAKDSRIRMMPDVHAGAGCTIGTTMTIIDKICPNLVGIDIGCGMETLVIKADSPVSEKFDPERLDACIRKNIPFGRNIRKREHKFAEEIEFDKIRCKKANIYTARKSLGSLGGGNHFIEAGRDEVGNLYIVVHSGSRHLGLEVATYYQEAAWKQLNHTEEADIRDAIKKMKEEGRQEEIARLLPEIKDSVITDIPKPLAYAEGALFEDYINDMKILQKFAMFNRKAMIDTISVGLRLDKHDVVDQFTTIHNYIDTDAMILRKGSVRALKGEKLLIPINMRDGSLVCIGKGNEDWNYSAPHGAGRVMGRKEARYKLNMDEFKKSMEGIWSSTVCRDTIDEAPMAYKDMSEIAANIEPTAEIVSVIKPIFNFKAAE
ncbi:RtcB family protein [Treponema parvum]|uniref:3'-phosphate/5'-hydroxy nucleic acid ligase n=1 Tax=Treponema parvum TaxID=138851 RepID=A0A975F0Q3_9SPIR|nr:RtcB family protein [Treponema parvum]QTQ12145.1 RtcB family protein [Treponema parvum]